MQWADRIGQRLKPRDLHVFLVVAEERNIAKAAGRLAVSRPVVSRTIADLEHTLGVRLFDRGPKGVEVTAYGAVLMKRSVAIFDELRQSVNEIKHLADTKAGEVRFGCSEIWAAGLVPAVIARMSQRHPRLSFEMETITPSTLSAYLRERRGELAITRLIRGAVEPDIAVVPMFHERLMIVAGLGNKWASRRHIKLQDLMAEPWILSPFEIDASSPLTKACTAAGITPPIQPILSNSLNLRVGLLATSNYLTLVPGSVLEFEPWRCALKSIAVDHRSGSSRLRSSR